MVGYIGRSFRYASLATKPLRQVATGPDRRLIALPIMARSSVFAPRPGQSLRLMIGLGHDVSTFADRAERLGEEGKSPLYAAIDGRLAAIIAVADLSGAIVIAPVGR